MNKFKNFAEFSSKMNESNEPELKLVDFVDSFTKSVALKIEDMSGSDRVAKFDAIRMAASECNCQIIGVTDESDYTYVFIGSKDNNDQDLETFINDTTI